jgi:RNA polymerase sigma-70 factor (ECF subfamily)
MVLMMSLAPAVRARRIRVTVDAVRAASDGELLDALRAGDEQAFVALVDRYHASLVRFASTFVRSRAIAEEVAQDTWLAVVRGLETFEGRSTFNTWLFRILANRARSTGRREQRAGTPAAGALAATVPSTRFAADGAWSDPPRAWAEEADERIAAAQIAPRIVACLEQLPEVQRQVVVLRDVEGLPAADVCDLLGLTEANQRVLLHRGRARVRAMLEDEIGER